MGVAATESHFETTVIFPRRYGLPPLVMETCTGGGLRANVEKKGRGGAYKQASLPGPGEIEDITTGRSWEPGRDAAVAQRLRALQGLAGGVKVIKQPRGTDRNPHPTDPPEIWDDCRLATVSSPDQDDDSNRTGVLSLVLSPSAPAA